MGGSGSISGDGAVRLVAGDLDAVFLPGLGMLGASLRDRGTEILRRVEDLEDAAAKGSTAGIPLLHPWANRLDGLRYRAAGREVVLERSNPLLHFDDRGLPIHGVPWSRLRWRVAEAGPSKVAAVLAWEGDLLSVFPFPHRLEMSCGLDPEALTIAVELLASGGSAVPVAFGFHPYLAVPGVARSAWRISLPAMTRLGLDGRGIPDGGDAAAGAEDGPLGGRAFDDGFALETDRAVLALSGPGRRVSVEILEGYRYAQVYAPPGKEFAALEPMTAPANALSSGRGLRVVAPGETARAVFRIRLGGSEIRRDRIERR